MASFFCASKIIVFITFTLYVLLGNTISASRVFVTVSLYSAVRLTVTLFFPNAIETLYESRVSIQRIQVFVFIDEKKSLVATIVLIFLETMALLLWSRNF